MGFFLLFCSVLFLLFPSGKPNAHQCSFKLFFFCFVLVFFETHLLSFILLAARTGVIDEFNQHGDKFPSVMLLSLTAGGVGLNLVAASRVFLLDPVSRK